MAVAVLLAFVVACNKQPVEPTSSTGVLVSGRITVYATGTGVPGATVAFEDLGADNRYVVIATAITEATGAYTLTVPPGDHQPFVDGAWIGQIHLTGSSYRGDFLVRWGNCVARYGTVIDAQTLRPLTGVTVSVRAPGIDAHTLTETDGWYRLDLGCPSNGMVGFNTSELVALVAGYVESSKPTGLGIAGVTRVDFELKRQ